MKPKFIAGISLITILALASCSTSRITTAKVQNDDDVYYTKATAGDATMELPLPQEAYSDDDYDYYYYDSYASRLDRFYYYTPFNYYDDFYYDYAPYAYGGAYGGFGFGLGYYNPYYAWNPYYYGYGFGGYPYSYFGIGYGGGGYWGIYSAYRGYASTPGGRPYRGPGFPTAANGGQTHIGYNGAYPATMSHPGRPSVVTSVYGTRPTRGQADLSRPTREAINRPDYQPSFRPSSAPSSSGGSSSGGGSSNGGGGGRPSRP